MNPAKPTAQHLALIAAMAAAAQTAAVRCAGCAAGRRGRCAWRFIRLSSQTGMRWSITPAPPALPTPSAAPGCFAGWKPAPALPMKMRAWSAKPGDLIDATFHPRRNPNENNTPEAKRSAN